MFSEASFHLQFTSTYLINPQLSLSVWNLDGCHITVYNLQITILQFSQEGNDYF